MADPTKTGQQYPSFTWTVEREKIVELMRTIGDDNELFLDRDTARSEGYRDIPAPPTLITMPFCWNRLFPVIAADLDMDPARILHGEENYQYFEEIYPGDVLTGVLRITDVTEKSGKSGLMDVVRLQIVYRNQRSEIVMKVETLLIERKQDRRPA